MSVYRVSVQLLSKNFKCKDFHINFGATNLNSNRLLMGPSAAGAAFNNFNQPPQHRNYSALVQRNKCNTMVRTMNTNVRTLAIHEITKNIQLFTEKPRKVDKDPVTFRLNDPIEKPLVIILSWLLAKQKHLSKYTEIYINQGFDVLTIAITPWQLLWPVKGTQLIAADLVKFLENNAQSSPLLLHGFSVGGYVWGECMVHMARDTERYGAILDRICGQIWDSAADITEIPVGVPRALFPKNYTLQKALKGYMMYLLYHLKTFHEAATTHYIRSSQMFHSTLVKGPALFLLSKTDPVGAVSSNARLRESWESMGISCTWKCWEKSPHVSHFYKHKEEYTEALLNHLQLINMIGSPEKLRAKL